jgi:hypothetical protein
MIVMTNAARRHVELKRGLDVLMKTAGRKSDDNVARMSARKKKDFDEERKNVDMKSCSDDVMRNAEKSNV